MLWQAGFFLRRCFFIRGVHFLSRPCIRSWDAVAVFERWLGFEAISGEHALASGMGEHSRRVIPETPCVCKVFSAACLECLGTWLWPVLRMSIVIRPQGPSAEVLCAPGCSDITFA